MDSYAVQLKSSARKELDSLPDSVLFRIIRKIELLARDPDQQGVGNYEGTKTCGVFESATGA